VAESAVEPSRLQDTSEAPMARDSSRGAGSSILRTAIRLTTDVSTARRRESDVTTVGPSLSEEELDVRIACGANLNASGRVFRDPEARMVGRASRYESSDPSRVESLGELPDQGAVGWITVDSPGSVRLLEANRVLGTRSQHADQADPISHGRDDVVATGPATVPGQELHGHVSEYEYHEGPEDRLQLT